MTVLNYDSLLPLAPKYNINTQKLITERELARRYLKNKPNINYVSDVLKEIYPLKRAYPNILQLLQICLTVSTASCERFSALNRVKTYLCS